MNRTTRRQHLDHDSLDYEKHQVQSLYGKRSAAALAAMQAVCDAYGAGSREPAPEAAVGDDV